MHVGRRHEGPNRPTSAGPCGAMAMSHGSPPVPVTVAVTVLEAVSITETLAPNELVT